jgi:hypothetical protein
MSFLCLFIFRIVIVPWPLRIKSGTDYSEYNTELGVSLGRKVIAPLE